MHSDEHTEIVTGGNMAKAAGPYHPTPPPHVVWRPGLPEAGHALSVVSDHLTCRSSEGACVNLEYYKSWYTLAFT